MSRMPASARRLQTRSVVCRSVHRANRVRCGCVRHRHAWQTGTVLLRRNGEFQSVWLTCRCLARCGPLGHHHVLFAQDALSLATSFRPYATKLAAPRRGRALCRSRPPLALIPALFVILPERRGSRLRVQMAIFRHVGQLAGILDSPPFRRYVGFALARTGQIQPFQLGGAAVQPNGAGHGKSRRDLSRVAHARHCTALTVRNGLRFLVS